MSALDTAAITYSDDLHSSAVPSNSAASPAALWLAAFSPQSAPLSALPPSYISQQSSLSTQPLSPAAQFLSALSSPPHSASSTPTKAAETINGWSLGKIIGTGLSQVRTATNPTTGAVVAVKLVRYSTLADSAGEIIRLRREEQVWSGLNHEYILPLFSVHHTPELTAFFTLYCPEGTLLSLVTKSHNAGGVGLEGDLVRSIFREVTRGLQYLHETMGVVHGDIKLDNILIDEHGTCRIADFGNARYYRVGWEEPSVSVEYPPSSSSREPAEAPTPSTISHHMSLRRPRGGAATPRSRPRQISDVFSTRPTPSSSNPQERDIVLHASLPYAAPELLRQTSTRSDVCHPPQDIWALGCMLHALLTGVLPFSDAYEPRLLLKILNGEWEARSITQNADRVILRACLRVEADERWNIAKLVERVHEVGAVDYAAVVREAKEREREQERGRGRSAKERSRSRLRQAQALERASRSRSNVRREAREGSGERALAGSSSGSGSGRSPSLRDRSASRPRAMRERSASRPRGVRTSSGLSTSYPRSSPDFFLASTPASHQSSSALAVFTSDDEHSPSPHSPSPTSPSFHSNSHSQSHSRPPRGRRAPSSESRAASTELLTPLDEGAPAFSFHDVYAGRSMSRSRTRGRSRGVDELREVEEDELKEEVTDLFGEVGIGDGADGAGGTAGGSRRSSRGRSRTVPHKASMLSPHSEVAQTGSDDDFNDTANANGDNGGFIAEDSILEN